MIPRSDSMNTEDAICKAERYCSEQRSHLRDCIKEYRSLVHRRSRDNVTNARQEVTASYAVEGLLSRFSDDAVNSTYGMVWNAVDIPFTITDTTNPELDLTPLAAKLAETLERKNTGFKAGLRHILRCYLEFGTGWMYIFPSRDKGITHRVFSVMEVARSLDRENNPEIIFLDRGNKCGTLVQSQYDDDGKHFSVRHLPIHPSDNLDRLKYNPIQELSLTGNYNDGYPVGYGITALPDIKRYDNIIQVLTQSAAESLSPLQFVSSGVNNSNKAQHSDSKTMVVDAAINDRIFPVGFIPKPINSNDAWQIFQIAATNIRESFSFINRLLTVKDNAQMTATEVNVRTQSDLSQVRDTIESIFSFLNEVHRVQLYLLLDTPEFKDWKNLDPKNLDFFHTSVFKKDFEQQQILSINQGLDIIGKINQIFSMGNQTGLGTLINSQKLLENVAKISNIALRDEQQANALTALLQSASLLSQAAQPQGQPQGQPTQ